MTYYLKNLHKVNKIHDKTNMILVYNHESGHYQKSRKQHLCGKDVEKLELLYIADQKVKWCSYCRKM